MSYFSLNLTDGIINIKRLAPWVIISEILTWSDVLDIYGVNNWVNRVFPNSLRLLTPTVSHVSVSWRWWRLFHYNLHRRDEFAVSKSGWPLTTHYFVKIQKGNFWFFISSHLKLSGLKSCAGWRRIIRDITQFNTLTLFCLDFFLCFWAWRGPTYKTRKVLTLLWWNVARF